MVVTKSLEKGIGTKTPPVSNSQAKFKQSAKRTISSSLTNWQKFIKWLKRILVGEPRFKQLKAWLSKNNNLIEKLLLSACEFKVDLDAFLPRFWPEVFSINSKEVTIKTPLTLSNQKISQITKLTLQELAIIVINHKLTRWETTNDVFLRFGLRLKLNSVKLIPFFNDFYSIQSGQIKRHTNFVPALKKVNKLIAPKTTKLLENVIQKQLRLLLQNWSKTNQTILITLLNLLQAMILTSTVAALLPSKLIRYLTIKNDTVIVRNEMFEVETVYEILALTKFELTTIIDKIRLESNLLKSFWTWFNNNLSLFKRFKKLAIPLTLIDSDLGSYIEFKTLTIQEKLVFNAAVFKRIIGVSTFRIKQIINHFLVRQWINHNEKILISWKDVKLSFDWLEPDLSRKLLVKQKQVTLKTGVILSDLLTKKLITIKSQTLKRVLRIYKTTGKIIDAQKALKNKGFWQRIWNFWFPSKTATLSDDLIPDESLSLNLVNETTPPLNNIVAYRNNQKEYKDLVRTYSKKILQRKQIVGSVDTNLRPDEYIIEMKNMAKYFVTDKRVTRLFYNLNLKIKKNDFVVILGPSGSGKTTLLNILSGLDRSDVGDVFCAGINLTFLSNSDLTLFRRKYVSFVFQSYNLLPNLTALENVEIGAYLLPKDRAPFDIDELFEILEIDQQKNSYPVQMSGGQQQRVAIARAIAKHPRILFCDEPTGALDQTMSKKVLQTLLDINAKFKMTVVLITHNVEFAKIANSVIYIRDGQIQKHEAIQKPKSIKDLNW